jgi:hypothetical protein
VSRLRVTVVDTHDDGKVRRLKFVNGDGDDSMAATYETLFRAAAWLFDELLPDQQEKLAERYGFVRDPKQGRRR